MAGGTSTTVTDPDEGCPYCRATTGVQPITGTSPKVKAWSCSTCQTSWAIATVNPQPYFDRLGATIEQLARHVRYCGR
jgi:transposase-like protein